MKLKDLEGKHILSGVCRVAVEVDDSWNDNMHEGIQFCLDGVQYQCLENPDDGYRSYMDDIRTVEGPCRYTFPDTEVECVMDENPNNDVLHIIATENRKKILSVGTYEYDDLYPYCEFEYHPENLPCNEGKND